MPLFDQRCLEHRWGWERPLRAGGQGNTVRTCCGESGVRTFPQGTGAFPTYSATKLGGMPALRAPPFPPVHPRFSCRSAQVLTPCISVLKSSCPSFSIPEAPPGSRPPSGKDLHEEVMGRTPRPPPPCPAALPLCGASAQARGFLPHFCHLLLWALHLSSQVTL